MTKENSPNGQFHIVNLAIHSGVKKKSGLKLECIWSHGQWQKAGWSGPWEKNVWNGSTACTYGRHQRLSTKCEELCVDAHHKTCTTGGKKKKSM